MNEESSIFYGFSPNEFVALLIVSGFSPTNILRMNASIGFLGKLEVAEHRPLSIQAKFDPHPGSRDISHHRETIRDQAVVPVKRAIDYAVGIIPIERRSGPLTHVIVQNGQKNSTSGSWPAEDSEVLQYWQTQPSPGQLRDIRFSLEQLVSVSGGDAQSYNVNVDNAQAFFQDKISSIAPSSEAISALTSWSAMLCLCALADLEPWPVLPVLQAHFTNAFLPLLRPHVGSHAETVQLLQSRLLNERPRAAALSGWASIDEQARQLGQTGDINKEYFSGSANVSSVYFRSMIQVFEQHDEDYRLVRHTLAAAAVWESFLKPMMDPLLKRPTIAGMLAYLDGQDPSDRAGKCDIDAAANWTVTVYATFLYGWLGDLIDIQTEFAHGFKRRIFIG